MNDTDLIKVKYMSPNRGAHRVLGHTLFPVPFQGLTMYNKGNGYVIDYGRRAGGDVFLVHRADAETSAHLFQRIDDAVVHAPAIQSAPPPPPPSAPPLPQGSVPAPVLAQAPVPTAPTAPTAALTAPTATVDDAPSFVPASPDPHARELDQIGKIASGAGISREKLLELTELAEQAATAAGPLTPEQAFDQVVEDISRPAPKPILDVQLIPGITAEIAEQFEAAGITTVEQVLVLGVNGLQKFKGIGAVKAPVIIEAIQAYGV